MFYKLQFKKNTFTHWLIGLFALTLFGAALVTEFFQAPLITGQELERYRTLFTEKDFSDVQEVSLVNRLGKFEITKTNDPLENIWALTYPRELPANAITIDNVFDLLKDVKIQRVYSKDQINISNFSLNSPLVKMDFTDSYEKTFSISLGLVNPVDGTTYIMASNKDAIYQVEPIPSNVELLGLSDFVDPHVISFDHKNISRVEIYRGELNSNRSILKISKQEDGTWVGLNSDEPLELDETKVLEFLEKLTSLRSQFILDKRTEELEAAIERSLSRPYYSFKVFDSSERSISYVTSSILNRPLPDIRVDEGTSFLIQASNRSHPYIVGKDSLEVFNVDQDELKKLPFNKLFY